MSASMNKAILIGNVGGDPDVKTTSGGKKVASFTLATSESWRNKDGERQEKTEWHKVVIWNEGLAGVAEKYVFKGAKVSVVGKIQTRKWHDQQGTDRYTTEIVLDAFNGELVLLSSAREGGARQDRGGNDDGGERSSTRSSGRQDTRKPASRPDYMDDEIPF